MKRTGDATRVIAILLPGAGQVFTARLLVAAPGPSWDSIPGDLPKKREHMNSSSRC